MSAPARTAMHVLYKAIVKPVLFLQHPDSAHRRVVKMTAVVQRVPLLSGIPRTWSYRSKRLEQEVLGIKFANPVGLAAGFDKNIEMAPTMEAIGFGFMTGGSVTAEESPGNPHPWLHRLPHTKGLVVHTGLANQGVYKVGDRIDNYPTGLFHKMPLLVSIAATSTREAMTDKEAIADYHASLRQLDDRELGQGYEINISCPNTRGGERFADPKRLEDLLTSLDTLEVMRPIFVKMPIDMPWDSFRQLLDVIVKHNVHGVSIGNTTHDRRKVSTRDKLDNSVLGALSGAPTREVSTELIRKTYALYGKKLVIIGIGGVFSARDAYEKIRAGASLVGLVTGLVFEGPQIVGQINADLVRLLRHDGYETISEAIGIDAR